MSDLNSLQAIETATKDLQALNVFSLLANFPSHLTVNHFIATKDNASGLGGTSELFRACVFTASFDLPDPVLLPDVDSYEETKAGMSKFKADMSAYKESGKPYNDRLASLRSTVDRLDLLRKYTNLRSAIDFVSRHGVDDFVIDETLEIYQLPQTQRALILSAFQNALTSDAFYMYEDVLTPIPNDCNFSSIDGIDAMLELKRVKKIDRREMLFFERGFLNAIKCIKSVVSAGTLLNVCYEFDCKLGSSINTSTCINNLKKLFDGYVPAKRTRKAK